MFEEEDLEFPMKIIVVGNGRVGKSSLITRFVKGTYSDEYKKTLGVAFLEKQCFIKSINREVKFLLWDTAGQEEYDELTREYYKGSSACILAFSTIDRDSYDAIQKWNKKVIDQCGVIPTILVQTKLDLDGVHAKVTEKDSKDLADLLKMTLFRISSKQDFHVKELFEYLAHAYYKHKNNISEQPKKNEEVILKEEKIPKKVVQEEKEVKFGEIKKQAKKKKEKVEDEAEKNEKQNEIIRKNLKDDKKKKDPCRIF